MRDFETILRVLHSYRRLYENLYNGDSSRSGKDMADDIAAISRTICILERECEYELDQEAHSEAMLEQELGEEIPLKEWAAKNGICLGTARQKAGRGMLKTARKRGRDWFINKNEPNIDNRYKNSP